MSDETDEMVDSIFGDPRAAKVKRVQESYLAMITLTMLTMHLKERDDPEEYAKEYFGKLRMVTEKRMQDEIAEMRKSQESPLGKIFGALTGDPDDIERDMQDVLNDAHAGLLGAVLEMLKHQETQDG